MVDAVKQDQLERVLLFKEGIDFTLPNQAVHLLQIAKPRDLRRQHGLHRYRGPFHERRRLRVRHLRGAVHELRQESVS